MNRPCLVFPQSSIQPRSGDPDQVKVANIAFINLGGGPGPSHPSAITHFLAQKTPQRYKIEKTKQPQKPGKGGKGGMGRETNLPAKRKTTGTAAR